MLSPRQVRGFTLIELMVTLTVAALLLLAVMPSFSQWIANAKVRSVAEEIQNGLRQAQAEAIRRNRQTVFALTNATPALAATPVANGKNWYVQTVVLTGSAETSAEFVQGSNYATQAGVTVTGPAAVCFGSLGGLVTLASTATGLSTACSSTATSYTLVSANAVAGNNAYRTLKVLLTPGGQVRMCDPTRTLSATVPDGCPAS
ncbi:MAG: GspH/FimT family pseudopilin [Burkholderiales bacterium]|nr:GspH/FimT family pseudopilin [Burkholderiales bacterium]